MTKKEACALEALCEKRVKTALGESEVFISMTLNHKLKFRIMDFSISFDDDLCTIFYINYSGLWKDLMETCEKLSNVIQENKSDFELLLWAHKNVDNLKDE